MAGQGMEIYIRWLSLESYRMSRSFAGGMNMAWLEMAAVFGPVGYGMVRGGRGTVGSRLDGQVLVGSGKEITSGGSQNC